MSSYLEQRRAHIEADRPLKSKEKKPIAKVSEKRKKKLEEEKAARGEDDTIIEKWFKARRRELVGVCQCGCARKSSKHEDDHFRASIAHIFPKAIFESVKYHPLNWVERNFWKGCHSNMDNRSLDKWPMFADWEDIKERFHTLAPLLTDEERSHKFYSHLEKLIYDRK